MNVNQGQSQIVHDPEDFVSIGIRFLSWSVTVPRREINKE
jgi:hypothetical protein